MADQIVLTLPEDISARAHQIAEINSQTVEQVLIDHLKTLSTPLPPSEQAELDALHHLSDDALWTIAREQMPEEVQARAQELVAKNSVRTISEPEEAALDKLVERADRLMLRKAEAATILRDRGYSFNQQDFKPLHE